MSERSRMHSRRINSHEKVGEPSFGALVHLLIELGRNVDELAKLLLLRDKTLKDAVNMLAGPLCVIHLRMNGAGAHQDESAHGEDCCDLRWFCWRFVSWRKYTSKEVGRRKKMVRNRTVVRMRKGENR